jgi:hypothetical protein
MHARAVDDAATRVRELRWEEWGDLALAGLALAFSLAATQVYPSFAMPLFVGGLVVAALGVRALYRRWDLVDRLLREPDAYVIPEVVSHASRVATIESRRRMAEEIRGTLTDTQPSVAVRVDAVAADLEELAADLDDDELVLDPVRAVSCLRLLSDYSESPLRNPELPAEDLRSQLSQIRAGFRPSGERMDLGRGGSLLEQRV